MIKIGADPELFVKKNGEFRSAHDLIPGDKKHPFKVPNGAIQVDGVAAEFNIDPVLSRGEFLHNIQSVMSTLKEMIGVEYELCATPTATFDPLYFDSLPSTPKVLGCTPDFNAYTKKTNKPPKTNQPFRTGAGHVHVGWDSYLDCSDYQHHLFCCDLVKQLDAALFFSSLMWDSDEKRRTLYGKIGCFRPKSYGLEYRPMSNAWLNDPETVLYVYDATVHATQLFFDGVKMFEDERFLGLYRSYTEGTEDVLTYHLTDYLYYIEDQYNAPSIPMGRIENEVAA